MDDRLLEDSKSNGTATTIQPTAYPSGHYDVSEWAVACLFITVIVGIVGNSLVVVAFVKDRRLRVLFNLLVVHLAVVDISIGIVLAFTITVEFARLSFLFDSRFLCQACAVLTNALPAEQLIITHIMCNNRHRALQHGLSYTRHVQHWHTEKMVLFMTWVVTLATGFLMTDITLTIHPIEFHSCHFPKRLFYVNYTSFVNCLLLVGLLVALLCIIRDYRKLRRKPLPFMRLQDVETNPTDKTQPQEEMKGRENSRSSQSLVPRSPIHIFRNTTVNLSSESTPERTLELSSPCSSKVKTKLFDCKKDARPLFTKSSEKHNTETGSAEEGSKKSPKSLVYYSLMATSPRLRDKLSELISLNLPGSINEHQERLFVYRGQEPGMCKPMSSSRDAKNILESNLENDTENTSLSASYCSADDISTFIQHGLDKCLENIGLKNNRHGKISLARAVPMKIKSALGKGKSEIRKNVRIFESDKKAPGKVPDDAADNKPDELEGKVITSSLTDDLFVSSSSLSDDELTEFPLPRFRPRTDSLYTLRSRLSISEESVTDPTITDEIKENSVPSDDSASVEESDVCLKNVKGRREDSKLSTIGDDEDDQSIQRTEHNVKGKSDSLRTLLSCYGIPGGSNLKSSSKSSPASADLPMQTTENGTNSLAAETSNERTSLMVKAIASEITTVSNLMESRTLATFPTASPEPKHREEINIHDNTQSTECDGTLKECLKDNMGCENKEGEDEFSSQYLKNTHDDNNSSIKFENVNVAQEGISQACQRISELDDGFVVRLSERKSGFRNCQKERRFSNKQVSSSNNENNNALKHTHSRDSVKKKTSKYVDDSQSTSETCSKQDSRATGSVTVIQTELPAVEIEKAVNDWISFYGIQVAPSMKVIHENTLQSTKRSGHRRKLKSLIPTIKKKEPETYQLRVMHSFTNTNGVSPNVRHGLNSIEAQIDDRNDMGHSQRDIDLAVENWIAFYDIRQNLPPGCDYLKKHGNGKVGFDNSCSFPRPGVDNDALQRPRKIWVDFHDIQSPESSTQLVMNSKKERTMAVCGDEFALEDDPEQGVTEKSLLFTDKSQVMSTGLISSHLDGLNGTEAILTKADETGENERRKQNISARGKGRSHQISLSKVVSSGEDEYTTHSPGDNHREKSERGRTSLARVCKPLMFNQSFSFLSVSDALVQTANRPLRSLSESRIKKEINKAAMMEQPFLDCDTAVSFISFDKSMEPNVKIAESVQKKGDCLVTLDSLCNGKLSDTTYSETITQPNHVEENKDACKISQCKYEKIICNKRWASKQKVNISESQSSKLNNNSPVKIHRCEISDESFKIKAPKTQTINTISGWKNLTDDFTKEHSIADNGKNVKTKALPNFNDMSLRSKTGMEAIASTCPVNGKGFNHLSISPKEMLESLSISRRAFLVELGIYGDIEKGLIPLDKELMRFKVEDEEENCCPYCAQRKLDESKKMVSRDNHVFDEDVIGLEKVDGEKENSTNNSQKKMELSESIQTAQFSLSNNSSGAWLEEGQPGRSVDMEMTSLGGSDSILSFTELRPQNPGTNCFCMSSMNCQTGTFERLKISHPELSILIGLALIIFGQLTCWLPITVLYMYYDVTGFPTTPTNQELAFITLWCARMAFQPVVYAFYSKYFRESFAQLLSCRFSR